MAGGGTNGGVVHGATDEIRFHTAEHPHYVSDIHATLFPSARPQSGTPRSARPQAAGNGTRHPIKEIIA